jgi:hypothetical protein
MTLPVWPVTLPAAPALSGNKTKKQDNRIQSENEIGDKKVRRRYTGVMKDFDWPMTLTTAQKDIAKTFIETTLVDATLTFTVTDPESLETTVTCRILEIPEWEKVGPNAWHATMSVRRIY